MNDATLRTHGPRPLIRFERHLSQPPATVWRALTDPEGLKSWFPCDIATESWQIGATLTFRFRRGEAPPTTGTVLELDSPRLLAYTWGTETLRFELTPDAAGGTRLVFTDELDPGIAARNAAGWDLCLDHLAGSPVPATPWRPRFEHYVAAFEPALGPQEGPPPNVNRSST